MANIFKSSIGKKLIMSISGLFLILFLLLHATINSLYIFSKEAFVTGCEIMGSPIIGIMVPILAAGFVIHIVYAFILTAQNLNARGGYKRYGVANKAATDSWAARNMIVLGVIVLGVLAFHLTHFWADMQLKEWMGAHAEDPILLMETTFKSPIVVAIYLIWFVALWFHLTHGFWSAFHTIGMNNNVWMKRLKVLSYIFATIIAGAFAAVAIVACLRANGIM